MSVTASPSGRWMLVQPLLQANNKTPKLHGHDRPFAGNPPSSVVWNAFWVITTSCYIYTQTLIVYVLCRTAFQKYKTDLTKNAFRDLTLEAWRKSGTLQAIFSNAYSCIIIAVFWFKFHWNLFPVVQFTIRWFGQWLGAAQWWRIYASPGLFSLRW